MTVSAGARPAATLIKSAAEVAHEGKSVGAVSYLITCWIKIQLQTQEDVYSSDLTIISLIEDIVAKYVFELVILKKFGTVYMIIRRLWS
jgi:hypothetical protein